MAGHRRFLICVCTRWQNCGGSVRAARALTCPRTDCPTAGLLAPPGRRGAGAGRGRARAATAAALVHFVTAKCHSCNSWLWPKILVTRGWHEYRCAQGLRHTVVSRPSRRRALDADKGKQGWTGSPPGPRSFVTDLNPLALGSLVSVAGRRGGLGAPWSSSVVMHYIKRVAAFLAARLPGLLHKRTSLFTGRPPCGAAAAPVKPQVAPGGALRAMAGTCWLQARQRHQCLWHWSYKHQCLWHWSSKAPRPLGPWSCPAPCGLRAASAPCGRGRGQRRTTDDDLLRLDGIGADWSGVDWVGLGWVGSYWIRSDSTGLDLIGLGWVALAWFCHYVGPDWIGWE